MDLLCPLNTTSFFAQDNVNVDFLVHLKLSYSKTPLLESLCPLNTTSSFAWDSVKKGFNVLHWGLETTNVVGGFKNDGTVEFEFSGIASRWSDRLGWREGGVKQGQPDDKINNAQTLGPPIKSYLLLVFIK